MTLVEGQNSLRQLIETLPESNGNRSEAETRFHIIDTILMKCLGWPKDHIHVEVSQDQKYTDYELGHPRQAIWEAKREGRYFELPANPENKTLVDLPSILALGSEVKDALVQVQGYCSQRGVQLAVASNGHQFIAFLATRFDGKAPFKGRAIVIRSLSHFYEEFPFIWQHLSCDGVRERRIVRLLSTGQAGVPIKLSAKLLQYPKIRFQSDTHTTLKQVSELLIQDVLESSSIEGQFFKQCYCESGALSKYALVSKNILNARYAALFDDSEPHPSITPVKPSKKTDAFTPEVMAEAISRRPIVLIGDVGVGKTSFVKHLMYTTAFKEFRQALYIYLDLGSKASLSHDLKSFILNEISTQLNQKYSVNISSKVFIQGVYSQEIREFNLGLYGEYKETNPEKYNDKLIEFLENKISEQDHHIKKCVQYISKSQRKQVIICIDNADQRTFEIQQEAFIISQEFARNWDSTVFLSVRPQTFYKSKQSGALTAYPHKVFTISPPRVDTVIEKRLLFALKMAEGKIPVQTLTDVQLNIANLVHFLKALVYSLANNKEINELLSNITGGNIRAVVELVTNFIGSPNVDVEKIIDIESRKGHYLIPVHEFSKSALLGDYSHYNPETSLAMNIFDVKFADPKEHYLVGMILGYLDYDGDHKNRDGFVLLSSIISEFQSCGFTTEQIEDALRRATNKKVIETSQRLTFDEDETGLIGEMPSQFRSTTIGAYHLKRWICTFAYLDAMIFDTPIFDGNTSDAMMDKLESLNIEDRYDRALSFRNYLLSSWATLNITTRYFDLPSIFAQGEDNFERVKTAIVRNKSNSN